MPSEALALRWQDVNWEQGVLHVHARKTAHHKHGGERMVPIFPEVLPLLREVWEQAPEGAVHVIEHHRNHPNLGVMLSRIVRQAGLTPWAKIWHNMRASRCTELQQGGICSSSRHRLVRPYGSYCRAGVLDDHGGGFREGCRVQGHHNHGRWCKCGAASYRKWGEWAAGPKRHQ